MAATDIQVRIAMRERSRGKSQEQAAAKAVKCILAQPTSREIIFPNKTPHYSGQLIDYPKSTDRLLICTKSH